MKKIKMTIVAAMFCAAAFAGYTAYDRATMTDQERLMLANIEALTNIDEDSSETVNCLKNPDYCQGWGISICVGSICTYQNNLCAPLKNSTYGPCN